MRQSKRHIPPGSKTKQIFIICILIFCLLAAIALLLDIQTFTSPGQGQLIDTTTELQNIVLGMNAAPYIDQENRFSIVRPTGWNITKAPESWPYDIILHSRHGASINIIATEVDYNDFNQLLQRIEKKQKNYGLNMNIAPTNYHGIPAISRRTKLNNSEVYTLDFISDHVAHHIQCSIPYEILEKYQPVLRDVLNTYRPLPPTE